MEPTLTEGIVGLLAAAAAYFSIRAKLEAGAANKAVNHTEKGAPRLYDIALGNATTWRLFVSACATSRQLVKSFARDKKSTPKA